jgi:predicted outer membrane lipoprotein
MFPWAGMHILHPLMLALGTLIGNPFEVLTSIIYEAVKERKEQKAAANASKCQ